MIIIFTSIIKKIKNKVQLIKLIHMIPNFITKCWIKKIRDNRVNRNKKADKKATIKKTVKKNKSEKRNCKKYIEAIAKTKENEILNQLKNKLKWNE